MLNLVATLPYLTQLLRSWSLGRIMADHLHQGLHEGR
jgi:hypothetical protein